MFRLLSPFSPHLMKLRWHRPTDWALLRSHLHPPGPLPPEHPELTLPDLTSWPVLRLPSIPSLPSFTLSHAWIYFLHSTYQKLMLIHYLGVCFLFVVYLSLPTRKRICISGTQDSYFFCSLIYLLNLKHWLVHRIIWLTSVSELTLSFKALCLLVFFKL